MIKVGFIGAGNMGSALAKAATLTGDATVYIYDKDDLSLSVRKALKNYFYKKTKQAPLIIVSVIDV